MLWISPSWLVFLSSFVFHTVHIVWLQHRHHSLTQRSQLSEFITIMSQWLGVNLLGSSKLQRLWSLQPSLACSTSRMSNPHKRPLSAYSMPTALRYLSRLRSQLSLVASQLIGQLLCWMCPRLLSNRKKPYHWRLNDWWPGIGPTISTQTAACWRKMLTNHISN